MHRNSTVILGVLGLVAVISGSLYSVTIAVAAPSSRITTSQGLTMDVVLPAIRDQATREQNGLQKILTFEMSGGSLEIGQLQPDLRVDSLVNASPENRQISFQYFVDIRDDLTESVYHCSDIRLHILLDGKEVYVTDFLGYDDRSPSLPIATDKIIINNVSKGEHYLGLIPEGRAGGCNSQGYVLSWGGTLAVFE